MTVLLIDDEVRAAIRSTIERARANPVPWEVGREVAIDDRAMPTATLNLSDRKEHTAEVRARYRPECIQFTGGLRVCISFEYQPAGLIRHLSVSMPGQMVSLAVLIAVADAFGFPEFPPHDGRVWLEEYELGSRAVNVARLEAPRPEPSSALQ